MRPDGVCLKARVSLRALSFARQSRVFAEKSTVVFHQVNAGGQNGQEEAAEDHADEDEEAVLHSADKLRQTRQAEQIQAIHFWGGTDAVRSVSRVVGRQ